MLTLFRHLLRSKIALILIGLLMVSLSVWGITDVFRPKPGASLAKIGSRSVAAKDVERFADRFVRTQNAQGRSITKSDLVANGQMDQIINLLSDRSLTAEYLDNLGLEASKKSAADIIRKMDGVRNEISGEFDEDLYKYQLSQMGFTPVEYENGLKDDLTYELLRNGLTTGLIPPQGLTDLWSTFQSEARNIAFFTMTSDDLPEPVEAVSDEDLLEFYKESESLLEEPERRQFSLIAVNAEDFYHKVEISEDDVRAEYDAQLTRFSSPPTRAFKAIRYNSEADARDALGLLSGGAPIDAVLARGGQLTTDQSMLQSEIPDAAFAGGVFRAPIELWTGPVPQLDGKYAVVFVENETLGDLIPFDDVKAQVKRELTQSRAERLYSRSFEDIDDAVGGGFPLEEMADIVGSPVYTYPPVDSRGRTKEGMLIRNLALLDDALSYGFGLYPDETSDRRDGGDTQYVIRLDKIVEPSVPALDEIHDELAEVLFERRKNEALTKYVEEASDRIQDGTSSITVEAQALGKTVERPPEAIKRQTGQNQGFSQTALAQIFNSALDEPFTAPLQSGVFFGVIEAIQLPDAASLEALRVTSRSELLPSLNNDFDQGLSIEANQNVDVVLNPALIEAYLSQYKSEE